MDAWCMSTGRGLGCCDPALSVPWQEAVCDARAGEAERRVIATPSRLNPLTNSKYEGGFEPENEVWAA